MSRPKDIGTRAETAVVRYLQAYGFPYAERRALTGSQDQGDITGTPGVCWEVKARKKPVSDADVAGWMVETEVERGHAGAEFGVLVVRRNGVGEGRAGQWWAYLPVEDVATLANIAEGLPSLRPNLPARPARLFLADAVTLLRGAGYGTPNGDRS